MMRNQLIKRLGFARSKRRKLCPRRFERIAYPRGPGFHAEARRQGDLVAATYKDDEEIAWWLDNAEAELERGIDEDRAG